MGRVREYPIYKELADAYDFCNDSFFGGRLPECIITLTKKIDVAGYFHPRYFKGNDKKTINRKKHEIAMNIKLLSVREVELTLATLVHEMCHMRTFEDGNYGRENYHNKQWSKLMEEIGLIPSHNSMPGGKKVGQSMSHYIQEGGMFQIKIKELIKNNYLIPFVENIDINGEVKSYKEKEIMKIAVPGKLGYYKDNNGNEFKGKAIRCGKNKEGEEIIKIIVENKNSKIKINYKCDCSTVQGKPGLKITCNLCGKNMIDKNILK